MTPDAFEDKPEGAGYSRSQIGNICCQFENTWQAALFDVIAVAHPIVAQDVAVIPERLDDAGANHQGLIFLLVAARSARKIGGYEALQV